MKLPNGYGGIVNLGKRRRKPYAVRVTIGWGADKRQLYKYIGYFATKKEALECLVEYHKNPHAMDARSVTLLEVWERWSKRHFPKIAPTTATNYKSVFKKLETLNSTPFRELRTYHFQPIVDNYKEGTAKMIKAIIHLLYEYAIENDIASKDYSQFIDLPISEKKKKTIFTLEEIDALWSREGEMYADILLILLYSGMRISELLEMQSANVDLDKRVMVGGKKTINGIGRTIPLHNKIVPLIKRHKGSKWMFQGKNGGRKHYNNIGLDIHAFIREDMKMEHTIHETRHTFVSQATRLRMDKLYLRKIVGHGAGDVTEKVYTHVSAEDLVKVIDTFDY